MSISCCELCPEVLYVLMIPIASVMLCICYAETAEEDVRPSTRGVPPSEQQREPSLWDTVRGGLGKPHGE